MHFDSQFLQLPARLAILQAGEFEAQLLQTAGGGGPTTSELAVPRSVGARVPVIYKHFGK